MLLSFVIIAFIGSGLSFKIRTRFSQRYYVTNSPGGACTIRLDATKIDEGGALLGQLWYTTSNMPTAQNPCFENSVLFFEEY